ncbi:non-ribosomal peptide synthetase [Hwangdonia seohaensis]|uniref:Amino acid adenylation domain-containing protein n=1 Tax=Hwangdonia seohaensis TaxID=1240727 RepID=A0ABW3RAI1_9FLAO|nr:amino acid adenylation domain-containing protein [Hwangdonia seohaensis]
MEKESQKISLLDRWKNRDKYNLSINPIEKAPVGIKIPLSHGQQRLWFLQQMYPKNAFYNYSETYTFNGHLDEPILVESLKNVYKEHDILKTTYHIEDGVVFQKINDDSELHIDTHDFSPLTETEKKVKCEKIIEADAGEYFDLTKPPLVRATLIKTNTTKYILQITLHHIITDKWSMQIFREHLAGHYKALSLNNNNFSKKTVLQYTDYGYWQSKNEINKNSLNYWKTKLSGNIPVLNLPTDFTRPLHPTFKGAASFTQHYSKATSNNILTFAKQLGTTPYVLMLTVYNVFLYRCSGQTDILIGSPITNRDQKVLEDIIGFFNETIILRTNCSPNITFKDLVNKVKLNTLAAFENKNVPFDALVKALKVERSLAINPFFQVMFLYHAVPENPSFNENVDLIHTWHDFKVSKFDLTLYIAEENGILSSTFEYTSDLFKESTINRFQEYFKLLLEGAIKNPERRILELPMLTDSEKQFFLNQEKPASNHFSEFKGIHTIIENISVSHPNNIAVTYKGISITYKVLNDKASLIANHLINHINTPNEIVGLCLDRSVDMIVAMLGILKAGCAYLPIDPEYPEQRIHFMINDAKVNTVITQQHFSQIFKAPDTKQLFIEALNAPVSPIKQKITDANNTDIAYVIYTSGSTGQPKGVSITHKNIISSTAGRLDFYDGNPSAFLLMSSISFDSSKAGIFWTLCTGGNLVIAEKRMEQDVDSIANIIQDQSISHTLMLPSLYKLILEYVNAKKLKSLKTAIVAGEACYPNLASAHFNKLNGVKLYNEYGPTEATVWCTAHQIKNTDYQIIPIGKPVAGAEIYLLDQHLNLVPFGSVGEIYIGGHGLASGYINNPKLSDKAFIKDPYNPSKKLYKTGDLGKYTSDKNIEFLGRADQQIKIRGFRVELNEIEKVIKDYNAAIKNAVVLVDDDNSTDFKNLDKTMPIKQLVDVLKMMDNEDLDAIFSSINALNSDEQKFLLNQIEA